MTSIKFVEATPDLARQLAPHLRAADVNECRVITGMAIEDALVYSIDNSDWSYVAYINGKPVSIFGVGSHPDFPRYGVPWMVGTSDLIRHSGTLMRVAPLLVKRMKKTYPILTNVVDAHNRVHVRWLKRLGFTLTAPQVGLGADPTAPLIIFTG